jgi:phenylalanyl-tRNA synthetase alpha chain
MGPTIFRLQRIKGSATLEKIQNRNEQYDTMIAHLIQRVEEYKKQFFLELAPLKTAHELELFRVRHLGRQGSLALLMQEMSSLSLEEKRVAGPLFNTLKEEAQKAFKDHEAMLEQARIDAEQLKTAHFDVTAYKPEQARGSLHPYSLVTELVEDIFISMGFEIVEGPELEEDFYNFKALNIPDDHPARDMQDTFWLTLPGLLMRTHTSSVEIHSMLKKKPPLAIAVPGRAYRNEATDASHDFMFLQLEGLFVDKGVSLSNLLATMKSFLQTFFEKKDISIKVRPTYYPFVEPGIDFAMSCLFCKTGCATCKKTGWIEIGGAGLTHPNVLRACSIDPEVYSGFAFGMGLTRLVMLKYGISDIRLLLSNKVEFLQQF